MKTNRSSDIHGRIFRWVISCLKLLRSIPRDAVSVVIIQQLAKACSSVGANDREAVSSSSDKDFVAKYQIARKELSESIYWLEILQELYQTAGLDDCLKEGEELLKILSQVVLNVKRRARI